MSKVTPPIVREVLPRRRLFALLDRMRKRPVIWVCGPPGCGKTTLVASYLAARKTRCLWYQIDPGDGDAATFFYYLGQAARRATPRIRKPLPLLTPEYLQDVATFASRYFESLYQRLKSPSVLVFDNCQEVPAASPLHEIILSASSRLPEGVNAIVVSRSEPPPAFVRLRANRTMGVLGWSDLRLTLEESTGMTRLKARQKPSKETLLNLYKATDGWAAGLILMLESLGRKLIEPRLLGKLTPEEIVDYFGNELFNKADTEIQEFLLKTAFLPEMTSRMAEELTGVPHASRILSALSRSNTFTEKRFDVEPVYQYHPLFREFLLSRAKGALPKGDVSAVSSRAAAVLEEAGQAESAVRLLRDLSDWEGLVRLITKHAPGMVAQGRYRPLEDWLNTLPPRILEGNPWLLYWMGSCRLPYHPALSQPCFEKAFEKFKADQNTAGMFVAWSGVVASIIAGFENFSPLDPWISALGELMAVLKGFPSPEIGLRVSLSMLSALMLRQPQHPMIEAWAERALSLAEKCSAVNPRVQTLSRLVIYRTYRGDYRRAALAVNSLQQLASSQNVDPLSLIMAKHAESAYFLHTGRYEESLNAVSAGLELSRTTGVRVYEHFLLGQGAASALRRDDLAGAGKFLEQMRPPSARLKPWDACFYHHLRTAESLIRSDLNQAALHADLALKWCNEMGNPFSLVQCRLAEAHVLHELGKDREADESLAHSLEMARRIKSRLWEFYGLLAQALFALDRGEGASCLAFLLQALVTGREEGYVYTFIHQPGAMVRLFVKALEAGIEVDYVQALIRRRELVPDPPPLHLESWPWPLRIYTLGRFEWARDGKLIRFSRKVQQKPLALLKALIAFGGKGVREDQIEDALWPEADGDAAHRSFKTNLHRLRQLLGHEKAIQLQEGRVTLDPRYGWVDVWAFEHLAGQAEAQWDKGKNEGAAQLTEKALRMYKEAFLSRENEQPWVISMRERLRGKFLRGVERLALYRRRSSQWEEAMDCYRKGLEVDELAEGFYQGLMSSHQHLGQTAEAISVYHRCKRALSRGLGIEPSAKTEEIYRTIFSKER